MKQINQILEITRESTEPLATK